MECCFNWEVELMTDVITALVDMLRVEAIGDRAGFNRVWELLYTGVSTAASLKGLAFTIRAQHESPPNYAKTTGLPTQISTPATQLSSAPRSPATCPSCRYYLSCLARDLRAHIHKQDST